MAANSPLDATQLSALSRFFCSAVLLEMGRRGASPLLMRLANDAGLLDAVSRSSRVKHLFELAFTLLKKRRHRDEYIYKTALTQKVLLGTHSLQTASMLTEFRVGTCKADLVILNGTATAYEIKSERDSLNRLDRQVDMYRKVFANVYVIAAEEHADSIVRRVPGDVGVLKLTSRYQISSVREGKEHVNRILPLAVFESIRLEEAKRILELLGSELPNVPNTQLYGALREKFASLSPSGVHYAMIHVLKKTRSLTPLGDVLTKLPKSLHAAALSTPLRFADRARLISAVDTRLRDARQWG